MKIMKKVFIQRMRKSERGQSLVEMAISLIVILYLLMGAVEFSMALFQYVTISDAAQEAAVYASIHPSDTNDIKQRAIATASDLVVLDPTWITVQLAGNSDAFCEGLSAVDNKPNSIEVLITFDHNIFLPLVTPMIGSNKIHLKADVTNTILYQCP